MEVFNLTVREYVSMWVDTKATVEAESLEDAIEQIRYDDSDVKYSETDYEYDTMTYPDDEREIEIYDEHNNILYP